MNYSNILLVSFFSGLSDILLSKVSVFSGTNGIFFSNFSLFLGFNFILLFKVFLCSCLNVFILSKASLFSLLNVTFFYFPKFISRSHCYSMPGRRCNCILSTLLVRDNSRMSLRLYPHEFPLTWLPLVEGNIYRCFYRTW
jgi:hypothetical protein